MTMSEILKKAYGEKLQEIFNTSKPIYFDRVFLRVLDRVSNDFFSNLNNISGFSGFSTWPGFSDLIKFEFAKIIIRTYSVILEREYLSEDDYIEYCTYIFRSDISMDVIQNAAEQYSDLLEK